MSIERPTHITSFTGDEFQRVKNRWIRKPQIEIEADCHRVIEDEKVSSILYNKSDLSLISMGFSPKDVDQWTKDIANGKVPTGFSSLEEFILIVKSNRHFRYNRNT